MTLTNRELAELLALESDRHEGNKQKAARRSARIALAWPLEAADVAEAGEKLTVLPSVGPWVARLILDWLEKDEEVEIDTDPLRTDFQTFAGAIAQTSEPGSWRDEVRGDLQMHTTYSDGSLSVAEMAELCIGLDYEYIAITDHSKGLKIAGGMDEERLAVQGAEIDAVNVDIANSGRDFRVLKAIEMNLSPDGGGDMEPEALAQLDLVLGSFHSQLRKKEDQTNRYMAGVRNPDIHVLGHPRGRQWNFRLGLIADWGKVFAEAARLDKAVEIDSHPNRQDLNVDLLHLAREADCRISLGTDAHYEPELEFIDIGVSAAMKAGIDKERIINLMPVEELLGWTASLGAGSKTLRRG